jgi:pimeloyl-ACP methyl ester carboxylesterase
MNKIFIAVAILLIGVVSYFLIQGSIGSTGSGSIQGKLISVGTHKLHLNCVGKGSHTVLFEAGLGDWSLNWLDIQAQVSKKFGVQACAYDRAGYGWSESGPLPRKADRMADELILLLDNSKIEGKVVLVGHSLGGLVSRVFANRYPHRVAGLILVDATPPTFRPSESQLQGIGGYINWLETNLEELESNGPPSDLEAAVPDDQVPPYISEENKTIWKKQYMNARFFETNLSELESNRGENLAPYESTRIDESIPLVLLVRGAPPAELEQAVANYQIWLTAQEIQAAISTNSQMYIIDGAGHYIYVDNPDAIIDVIGNMLIEIN